MTKNQADLKSQIIKQLVESGKYDELTILLKQRLHETGWIPELCHRLEEILSKEEAQSPADIKFNSVVSKLDLLDLYNGKLDPETKKMVYLQLHQFLLDNFEVL